MKKTLLQEEFELELVPAGIQPSGRYHLLFLLLLVGIAAVGLHPNPLGQTILTYLPSGTGKLAWSVIADGGNLASEIRFALKPSREYCLRSLQCL